MIRINQVKLSVFEYSDEKLKEKCARLLKVRPENIRKLKIMRRSADARKKNDIMFSFTVDVKLSDSVTGPSAETEKLYIKKLKNKDISYEDNIPLTIDCEGARPFARRPVIAGAGPCGLFCALVLSEAGLRPIVLERGEAVEDRAVSVEEFFSAGSLNPDSNVQFGEGGAGTFSDGKLNTSIKGQGSYIRYVLETFRKFGAQKEILYDAKPHIGTDKLIDIVKNIRETIKELGGTVLFNTKLVGFEIARGNEGEKKISSVIIESSCCGGKFDKKAYKEAGAEICEGVEASGLYKIAADRCILAIGHSARDTFELLYNEYGISMEKKPFAMGVRVQHPQEMINEALYGKDDLSKKTAVLGPSPYKLTHRCENGRSVYSFCMCPGGYVVNSSSEEGCLCVNGMSYSDRASENANSAIIVNITPEDFPGESPLSGIEFQRKLEKAAYNAGGGNIPAETYGDFKKGSKKPSPPLSVTPVVKGYINMADIRGILPEYMSEAITEGMEAFSKIIPGFNREDALLCAVESRTSSPVKILRDEKFEASIKGIYPAGEGAGYAGGITSAAIDGIKTAQKLIEESKKGGGYDRNGEF